ncbi:hypothetical protein [Vibrio cholerae]|uniref:hypothetical protein n=1 Tax=Vibrio cholerae TaxID=666 RepID=UPI0009B194FC|nr:hypothetical protein [Vibrio cholerae]
MKKFETYRFNKVFIDDYKIFWINKGSAKLVDKNCLVSYTITENSVVLLKKNSIQRFSLMSLNDEQICVHVLTIKNKFVASLKHYLQGDLMIRNLYNERKDLLLWHCDLNDICVLGEIVASYDKTQYSEEFLKIFFLWFFF